LIVKNANIMWNILYQWIEKIDRKQDKI